MERDPEYIDFISKNITTALDFWKRHQKDEDAIAMLNNNIELATEAGAEMILKVEAKAFRKENLVTFFPVGVRLFGKEENDGSRTFEVPGAADAKLYAEMMGEPYLVFYAGSCGIAAHFAPSNVVSISVR